MKKKTSEENNKRMNTRDNMIVVKGKIKTTEILCCSYNAETKKWDVTFNNGRKYSYLYENIVWAKNPKIIDTNSLQVSNKNGHVFHHIEAIYEFALQGHFYWHICFKDGVEKDYRRDELQIESSCLTEKKSANVFAYIKQVAELCDIRNEESGEKILPNKFKKISYVGKDVALAKYLNPSTIHTFNRKENYMPIFPFGCNNSQYQAVKKAMQNQISVIQGPPGTGKTQTILNIIANIILQGKTVQIVSNNNSATDNVYEKLCSQKYNLGFIAATLGKSDNKKNFIGNQNGNYPDFSSWELNANRDIIKNKILEESKQLKNVFDKQERLASLKQENAQIETELEYFKQYVEETDVEIQKLKIKKHLGSKQWMELWQECQFISEEKNRVNLWFKIKNFIKYGITNWNFYHQDILKIITTFQFMYYNTKKIELLRKIQDIENYLNCVNKNLLDDLCNDSMYILKDKLAHKYAKNKQRRLFEEDALWKDSYKFLQEYPVILSTTFSSRDSLNADVVYDYLIMDEASQVDIATGALALSCAKNVVIVGDTKQLPNVVTEDTRNKADTIFDSYHLDEGYRFTKSFLQSILEVMPNVTQTLLREHYRCHPKIINFCNQKFYHGELIIMTEDKGEEDVLSVIKTVPGNHARNHYSQRQIDIIKNEIMPKFNLDENETGIITPYKNQVKAISDEIEGKCVDTVHKFQGKEKDTIIISTVDDEISDFADDPYLINVAVSRAKKKLVLIVTGNEQSKESNIIDLIHYIEYNNFEVMDSQIYSIFDYLYKQYTQERKEFLKNHKKISEYDSENLMYILIEDILKDNSYSSFDVVCHFPMNMLIRNLKLLNEEECRYAMNPATHLDFLIYNRISKKPVLAIEIDGYEYHKEGTIQAYRDELKNHIMKLYQIPLLRCPTNGSEERKKIVERLKEVVG